MESEVIVRCALHAKLPTLLLEATPRDQQDEGVARGGAALLGDDIQVAQELGELAQLQKLTMRMSSSKPSKQLAESLEMICTLQRLDIEDSDWDNGRNINFLHDVHRPPRLLRFIRMCGAMQGFPNWVGLLTNLVLFDLA